VSCTLWLWVYNLSMHNQLKTFFTQGVWKAVTMSAIVGAMVAASVIYLTPLRLIPVIEPSIEDVDARVIQEQMHANPERYIFLDVRPVNVFDVVHASGAKSAPLHTLYNLRHQLPKTGKTIVLICSGGLASGVGYSYLEHYGFFNILRVEGGIEAWQTANLPVATGTDPYIP
jgi:rhodanese-related sulfurtransferase